VRSACELYMKFRRDLTINRALWTFNFWGDLRCGDVRLFVVGLLGARGTSFCIVLFVVYATFCHCQALREEHLNYSPLAGRAESLSLCTPLPSRLNRGGGSVVSLRSKSFLLALKPSSASMRDDLIVLIVLLTQLLYQIPSHLLQHPLRTYLHCSSQSPCFPLSCFGLLRRDTQRASGI
jgi:hypothetical protein